MRAIRFACPFPSLRPEMAAPFAGARWRFNRADGSPAQVWADAALRVPLPGPDHAHGTALYLRAGDPAHVALISAAGAVALAVPLAQDGSAPRPDDGGLFAALPALALPPGVHTVRTEGWAQPGLGAGDYVADALAERLVDAHPRFCTRTADGRAFRLAPSHGMIVVEQGGARGTTASGAVNDQPAFQAAIAYARATGVERIGLAHAAYQLWCPPRHSDPGSHRFEDGQPLVIAPGTRVHIVGLAPQRTRLLFCGPDGQRQNGTAFQLVEGKVWRGGGFFVRTAPHGEGGPRSGLTLEHLIVDGGTARSRDGRIRADPATGAGWDVTHKGVWTQPDGRGGDITILDCDFTGWRGETVFCGNDTGATCRVRQSSFRQSDGQGLNLNSCRVDVADCRIADCFIGIEGWTGARGGRIVATRIEDCHGSVPGSGGAFALQGGKFGRSARSLYFAPTRVDPDEDPVGVIDITCVRSGKALVGCWLSGRLTLIDTPLIIGSGSTFADGTRHVDLDVALVLDGNQASQIAITGAGGRPGDMLTDAIRLRVHRSHAPGRRPDRARETSPVVWTGSLGPDIRVTLRGDRAGQPPRATGAVPDHAPRFD